MALKIARFTTKEKDIYQQNQDGMWDMIRTDVVLAEHFRDHPIFKYDLVDCSRNLNLFISFKQKPEFKLFSSIHIHDFAGSFTEERVVTDFKIGYRDSIRALVQNVANAETTKDRWLLKFFDEQGFNPNKVTEFLYLSIKNLGYKIECKELSDGWRWAVIDDSFSGCAFSIDASYEDRLMDKDSEFRDAPDFRTMNYVSLLIAGAFYNARYTHELETLQKIESERGPGLAKLVSQAKSLLPDIATAQAKIEASRERVSIQMLPAGSKISSDDIHTAHNKMS